jgi:CO dehydrogenase maturation factor
LVAALAALCFKSPGIDTTMKIAVTGKGGVGKTTLSAMLAVVWHLKGKSVIAIDADPDANLASALGLPLERSPVFLAEMRDLIRQRTGAKDAFGGYFQLNPKVDDIPVEYSQRIGNVRLLALGGVKSGGAGCICPASALIKALLTHLTLASDEALIMDMDAGIEHLGRATTQSMDALLVVVDENPWSVQTALRVRALARDIGIKNLFSVVNRVNENTDLAALELSLQGIPIAGALPMDTRLCLGIVQDADERHLTPTDVLTDLCPAIERILAQIAHARHP